MKTIRIMCAAFVAAMTLASCQKEQEIIPESKTLKSVEVKLNNVAPVSKAIGGLPESLEGKNIQLNSLQFFFSDGTTLYEAKDAEGKKADVYFDADELAALNGNISAKFHFLPAAVKKVLVVGNHSELVVTTQASLDKDLEIINYQDVTNFPLYAEGALGVAVSNSHNNGENGHLSNVYSVNLDVYPHVARFEITGIGCSFVSNSGKIVKVNKIAFADFYDKCNFLTGNCLTGTLRSVQLNQQDIFKYFQEQMSVTKWNNDFFNGLNGQPNSGNSHPLVELTSTNSFVTTDIAYNFFCKGAPSPLLLLDVTEYESQEALEAGNGTPGYLHTNVYRLNSTDPVSSFEPGKIYRMSINFNEDNLQHQERCLDINLKVAEWIVINVTPEF